MTHWITWILLQLLIAATMTIGLLSAHPPMGSIVTYLTVIWGLAAAHIALYLWYQISAARSRATAHEQAAAWNAYQWQQWNNYQQWQNQIAAQSPRNTRSR